MSLSSMLMPGSSGMGWDRVVRGTVQQRQGRRKAAALRAAMALVEPVERRVLLAAPEVLFTTSNEVGFNLRAGLFMDNWLNGTSTKSTGPSARDEWNLAVGHAWSNSASEWAVASSQVAQYDNRVMQLDFHQSQSWVHSGGGEIFANQTWNHMGFSAYVEGAPGTRYQVDAFVSYRTDQSTDSAGPINVFGQSISSGSNVFMHWQGQTTDNTIQKDGKTYSLAESRYLTDDTWYAFSGIMGVGAQTHIAVHRVMITYQVTPWGCPPPDLAEDNGSDWAASAEGGTASATTDTTRYTTGSSSVRFVTDGGFDTVLSYQAPVAAGWDVTGYDYLNLDVYAENTHTFQGVNPIVRLTDVDGDYIEYRPYSNGGEVDMLTPAIGRWQTLTIPLNAPAGAANGWRGTATGTPDLSRVASIEMHADTWDYGFTLWVDDVGFRNAKAVSIPDLALEAAVRDRLGRPTGTLTDADMAGLVDLDISGRGIVSLEGLQAATNLQTLNASRNSISDLSPLAGITSLWELVCGENQISDLQPLQNLTGLRGLHLDTNQITDLSPLAGLVNLEFLALWHNQIQSIASLSGLVRLVELHLSENLVANISALQTLTALRVLSLASNQISGISALAGLSNMECLTLAGNSISDLTAVSGMVKLVSLDIGRNQIASLIPLASVTGLKSLLAYENQISNASPLAGLTALEVLILNSNPLGANGAAPLANLTLLRELQLARTQIASISSVQSMTNLETLALQENGISDLTPIGNMAKLGWLDVSRNNVSVLPALSGITPGLEYLCVSDNHIANLSAISGLPNLRELYASGNDATVAPNLSGMTKLASLDIGRNQITSLATVAGAMALRNLWAYENQINNASPLAGLTALEVLNLSSNPLGASGAAPLADLTSLRELCLANTQIGSITSLQALTNLEVLELQANNIVALSPIAGMHKLRRLDAGGNQLTSLPNLSDIAPGLEFLSVWDNQIADLSVIHGLPELRELHAGGNGATVAPNLSGMTKLYVLNLSSDQLASIAFVAPATALEQLVLNGNPISDLSPLSGLTLLQTLELDTGNLTSLAGADWAGKLQLQTVAIESNYLDLSAGSANLLTVQSMVARGVNVAYANQRQSLRLSSSMLSEGWAAGTPVGTCSASGLGAGLTVTYSLVAGDGSTDNAAFSIVDNTLRTAREFDYETQSTCSVRVRAADSAGLAIERIVAINVTHVDEVQIQLLGQAGGSVGRAYGVVVIGGYAYVAGYTTGLHIVDISNPFSPMRVGGYDTGGDARAVSVVGRYAYVADGYSGLQIIDISNATAPVWVGGYDTSQYTCSVSVEGHYAYVADGHNGLAIIDISNPVSPAWVGGYDTGYAYAVSVVGNHAYVVDYASGLQIIDISNPAAPVRVGGCDTSGDAWRVSVVGSYGYVADGEGGLQIFDISNPASPVRVGGYDTVGYAYDLSVVGGYAYVADDTSGLQVIDISSPVSPFWVGGFDTSGNARGVSVVGGYVYVADDSNGLLILRAGMAPTDMQLSNASVSENRSVGTAVGIFTSSDLNVGETLTYSLVSGTGSVDNSLFQIVGNELRTSATFDFEAGSNYSIRVRSTDQDGLWFEKAFTISVTNVNETPTDITLSASSIPENQPVGTAVGTLSSTDPDAGNTFTYSLASGDGSTDNGSFTIAGSSTLKTAASFNYEAKSGYSIRVRTTDQGGLSYEKVFTISVLNAAEVVPTISGISTDTGISSSDGVTSDKTLVINGTSEPGMSISIYQDGVFTAMVTANASGSWLFDYSVVSLADGNYGFTATASDTLGHTTAASAAYGVTVDSTAPKVTAVYVRGSTWASGYLSFLAANTPGSSSTYGYAIPVGSGSLQLQTLPWRNLNRISIAFSEDVSIAQAQFAIVGSVGSYSVSGFTYSSSDHVATWSLSAVIGPDKLYVALPGSGSTPVTDVAGNVLDGERTNPSSYSDAGPTNSFPSGNGSAGGDFAFRLDVLPGDSTGGSLGKVNVADIAQTKSRSNLPVTVSTYRSDFDGNNLVNVADIAYVKTKSNVYSLPVNPPVLPVFGSAFSQVSLLLSRKHPFM